MKAFMAMRELWQGWIEAWRDMEAHARRRGWEITPLEIAPPASEQPNSRI